MTLPPARTLDIPRRWRKSAAMLFLRGFQYSGRLGALRDGICSAGRTGRLPHWFLDAAAACALGLDFARTRVCYLACEVCSISGVERDLWDGYDLHITMPSGDECQ